MASTNDTGKKTGTGGQPTREEQPRPTSEDKFVEEFLAKLEKLGFKVNSPEEVRRQYGGKICADFIPYPRKKGEEPGTQAPNPGKPREPFPNKDSGPKKE